MVIITTLVVATAVKTVLTYKTTSLLVDPIILLCLTRTRAAKRFGRHLFSQIVEKCAEHPELLPETQRSKFNATPLHLRRPKPGHTHGKSAADRSAGEDFCINVAESLALEPYLNQMSKPDERRGLSGSRSYFWTKDVTIGTQSFNPRKHHAIISIDVDYYAEQPYELVEYFQPHFLYTFCPTRAAKGEGEYTFTFDKDNVVHYSVSGGGGYTHEVWNWSVDSILVSKCIPFTNIPYACATYLVDSRKVDEHHNVVSLTPVAKWGICTAWLANMLGSSKLERLKPSKHGFTRLEVHDVNGVTISTSKSGSYGSVETTLAVDEAITIVNNRASTPIQLPQICGFIKTDDDEDYTNLRVSAAILLEYHRSDSGHPGTQVFPVAEAVRAYTYKLEDYDPSDKPSVEAFMNPMVHGAFAPYRNHSTEKRAFDSRINDLAGGKVEMTAFDLRCMDEFACLLFPTPGILHPSELDEVFERQARPAQQSILWRSMYETPHRIAKYFMKNETYGNIKDPRAIGTINGCDKRDMSRFTYAISNHIKEEASNSNKFQWYAFGHSTKHVAETIAHICSQAKKVLTTDYERWDGNKKGCFRLLEHKIYVRAFHRDYVEELLDLQGSMFNLPGTGRFREPFVNKVVAGPAQISGVPATALDNTIDNKYIDYRTRRGVKHPNGKYHSPKEAYEALGLYGGDDGVSADIDEKALEATARRYGAKLTSKQVYRGNPGVTMLSRLYGPDVWFGNPNSMCDLYRNLAKFHTTVKLPSNVTPLDKFKEKARAYYQTDRNTPIIGPLVSRCMNLDPSTEIVNLKTTCMARWGSLAPSDQQYPNEDDGWMLQTAEAQLNGFDFVSYDNWLGTIKRVEDCLSPPLCLEPRLAKTKVTVVCAGEIVVPERKAASPPPSSTKRAKSKRKRTTRSDPSNMSTESRPRGRVGRKR
jgi:hypothetical protein